MRLIANLFLFVIEYCFKLAAPLAALIATAARGGFFAKMMEGFQSLPEAVRESIWWIKNIPEVGKIVNDYNTLTAANFNQKYGSGAVNYVMDYINEGVSYFQQVYMNLSEHPLVTVIAALIVFLIFYLLARLVRFVRQEGQGSFITKFERRAGDRVFKRGSTSSSGYEPTEWR
ncbi:hypothetical protein [Fodinibius sediminis]|uniref:Uncharacterized protein n=1 Tax=Fodinibius sediminis TaxID=1214077 RepID=A0A521BXN3_9BACT|nr:hypothetical protein [Fodinibius sediminis]SMO51959.1 hypothetical protein SAMN06265218_104166 [Fodinibius sediminis]